MNVVAAGCCCGGEIVLRPNHRMRRGQGATPAAFYLGLCRLRGILSPPASAMVILQAGNSYLSQRWCCRRAVLSCSSDGAAAIPKFGLEIKNHCTLEGCFRGNACIDSQVWV